MAGNMSYSEPLQSYSEPLQTRRNIVRVWGYAAIFFILVGASSVAISHAPLLLLPVGFLCLLGGIIGTLMLLLQDVDHSRGLQSTFVSDVDEIANRAAQLSEMAHTAARRMAALTADDARRASPPMPEPPRGSTVLERAVDERVP
jgi:hypothetical protein